MSLLWIEQELKWLENIIVLRCSDPAAEIPVPEHEIPPSYKIFIGEHEITIPERILLAIGMARHYRPDVFIPLLKNITDPLFFSLAGGAVKDNSLQYYPTLRTAIYLAGGSKLEKRIVLHQLFHGTNHLFRNGFMKMRQSFVTDDQEKADKEIYMDENTVKNFTELNFIPAGTDAFFQKQQAQLTFSEVVLTQKTRDELSFFITFLKNREKLLQLKTKKIKSGYVVIFAGEPGTGKTLTAKLIGSVFGYPVKVVNLAGVVSKYIGETEKNLDLIFNEAEVNHQMLFFDEADALFGKRTEVKDAHDKYANQETAFLLQRLESFNGVVILATNLREFSLSFDKAFQRRIRKVVHFEFPGYAERKSLWEGMLPEGYKFDEGSLEYLAFNYQLTGANINNIISNAMINALDSDTSVLSREMILPYVKDELIRTERMFKTVSDDMVHAYPESRYGRDITRGSF